MITFVQCLDFSHPFYLQAARPILEGLLPDLPDAAALIGFSPGGLGLDTKISGDHPWEPREMKIGYYSATG